MRVNSLAPCFNDLLKNENLPYMRYDLSFDDDLTKLINTTSEAFNPKVGLFLKSLNKSALNKNANKDLWTIDLESMWVDFCDSVNAKTGSSENVSLIQNTSFKLWLVNVWDFFKSSPSPTSQEPKKQPLVIAEDNMQRVFQTLDDNVIKINEAVSSECRESRIIEAGGRPKIGKSKRSSSLSTPLKLVQRQESSHYVCRELYSKINVIGFINEIHLKCSHSQILFLLRLLDTVDLFTQQLKEDGEQTLKFRTGGKDEKVKKESDKDELEESDEDASVNISLVVNSIEVELCINDHSKEKKSSKILEIIFFIFFGSENYLKMKQKFFINLDNKIFFQSLCQNTIIDPGFNCRIFF